MTGRKTKTVKKPMRKAAKRPSLGGRLFRFFIQTVSKLALAAGSFVVRNPVMTGGATAFAVVLGFVSANALWYQPEAHDAVFFRTRTDFVFKPTPRAVLAGGIMTEKTRQAASNVDHTKQPDLAEGNAAQTDSGSIGAGRMQLAGPVDEMLPALAPNADIEIARLQQRLSLLGIYTGAVDGFTGPQTREALDKWRALQQKLAVKQAGAIPATKSAPIDEVAQLIGSAVPVPETAPIAEKNKPQPMRAPDLASLTAKPDTPEVTKPNVAISSQDIVRVQAGLKAFGNDLVSVDGVPGATTKDAVRQFQKMFGMPSTGEIDAALIGKMREIGLIS